MQKQRQCYLGASSSLSVTSEMHLQVMLNSPLPTPVSTSSGDIVMFSSDPFVSSTAFSQSFAPGYFVCRMRICLKDWFGLNS